MGTVPYLTYGKSISLLFAEKSGDSVMWRSKEHKIFTNLSPNFGTGDTVAKSVGFSGMQLTKSYL
jgi:hypothetical protein